MADPVVIVGGGLAGISAALRLRDAGREVVLLERHGWLGGAAFSFRRGALSIDNGQHVFLRCCTAYRDLLTRMGAQDQVVVQDRLDIPVLMAGGRQAQLSRSAGIPAPAHLGSALARYALLTKRDRLRAIRGALALLRLDPDDQELDEQTLGSYLRSHGQNDATIDRLWGIVATATLNIEPDQASLALAAKVFRTGLLDRADAADIGYAAVPLGEVHSVRAERALTDAGVEVLTNHRVESIAAGATVCATGPDGPRQWRTDNVVLAVPPAVAFGIAPELHHSAAAPAARLTTSPIVNIHVVYDRQVTELPFAAAVDSPVQWIFDRTESSGLHDSQPGGQYLAVTVSAADDLIDVGSRAVQASFTAELQRLIPAAAQADVVDAFVTRERRATFRQAAGTRALRPAATDGPGSIVLAGTWTDTGWPDTMESAVRSGTVAADAVLSASARREYLSSTVRWPDMAPDVTDAL